MKCCNRCKENKTCDIIDIDNSSGWGVSKDYCSRFEFIGEGESCTNCRYLNGLCNDYDTCAGNKSYIDWEPIEETYTCWECDVDVTMSDHGFIEKGMDGRVTIALCKKCYKSIEKKKESCLNCDGYSECTPLRNTKYCGDWKPLVKQNKIELIAISNTNNLNVEYQLHRLAGRINELIIRTDK